MKHVSRFVPILAGAVAVTGGWGVVAVGCGSSSSGSGSDAGGIDGTTDVQGEDVVNPDTGGGFDASPTLDGDAGATLDADAGVAPDGDASAAPDGDAGPAPDGDAGVADSAVGFDGNAASFPSQVAATLCDRVASCCGTSGDAATFNFAGCSSSILPTGFNGSSTGSNLLDGGNIVFNAVAAQACLDALNEIDCETNEIPSAVEIQAYRNCFAALTGSLPAGSPCAGTIECAPGNFCLPVAGGVGDAGAIGLCQALAGDGGACGGLLGSSSASQAVCSYRGSGNTGLFCLSFNPSAPTEALDAAAWACMPQEPIGAGCTRNLACSSLECPGSASQCAASLVAVTAATCTAFALDAGMPTDAAGQ